MTSRTVRLSAVLIALGALVAVTACTTTADGTPQPAPDDGNSSTSTSESQSTGPTTPGKSEAPRVTTPLDGSAFAAAPCTSLTGAQLSDFGVNPPGDLRGEDGVFPPGCGWHGDGASISVGWLTDNENGLSDTYRRRELDAYFIETTVDGYPAVFTDGTDGRPSGRCGIVVGVSDTLTFYAVENGGQLEGDAACSRAKQVAAATLATVKAAS